MTEAEQARLEAEAIDLGYNNRRNIPGADAMLEAYWAKSAEVLEQARVVPDIAYGDGPEEYLDLYPVDGGTAGAPVHVFIHGGYWYAGSAKGYAFAAPPIQARGVLTVVLNYGLCPDVPIPRIVEQCRAALVWLWNNVAGYGGDRSRITVSGHSAGGHLAAMLAATDWRDLGPPQNLIKATCPISGLFDLAPLAKSWLQPTLNLTPEIVAACSPIRQAAGPSGPALICVGGEESDAFHAQSRDYLAFAQAAGAAARLFVVPSRNHISVLREFTGGGPLLEAIVELAHAAPASVVAGDTRP